MPFWVLHYHVVWATKNRSPLLVGSVESSVYDVIRSKSDELGCIIDAINGVSNHIHVAVRIKPSLSPGEWVAQVKGASSRTINLSGSVDKFRWQEGYGVLAFGATNLPYVVAHVQAQKGHHAAGKLVPYMERIDEEDAGR